ncbi:hypothetical protein [Variovorax sp. PBL-E5]|uniref:hypothetical protein n=1 Tax=Variovorax sp. PBL-E5 TaxID=434014 RepID=UPI0013181B48|nr:hypothetical protein [Variovorax sp. PBL-E5]VTU36979.1 hypothetical protein E5CHR_04453 [Variovorax sp. PBL-E5]
MDLDTPMPLAQVIAKILNPALAMLPLAMDSPRARLQLLTQGQQESLFKYRRQMGNGPARGFWQMERGGGVKGIFNFHTTTGILHQVCAARDCPFDIPMIWARLETDDILAACAARLLLWTDPYPLPAVDDPATAWDLYVRVWRPGKPIRDTWNGYHEAARAALGL